MTHLPLRVNGDRRADVQKLVPMIMGYYGVGLREAVSLDAVGDQEIRKFIDEAGTDDRRQNWRSGSCSANPTSG